MSALLADLYQLSMLQAYLDEGMGQTAVFELFVRKLPPGRNFLSVGAPIDGFGIGAVCDSWVAAVERSPCNPALRPV